MAFANDDSYGSDMHNMHTSYSPGITYGYTDFFPVCAEQSYDEETSMLDHMHPLEREDENFDSQIDLGEVYQNLQQTNVSVDKRLELFAVLKEQLRLGNVTLTRIAAYHVHFCAQQLINFNLRPGIGLLENNEKLIVPVLEFLREGLLMGDKTFAAVTLKSQLLPYLAKMVMTYAERTDLMTKNLSKMCAVDTLLGHSSVIPPFDTLKRLLEVPKVPDCFAETNVAKRADMQHRYDCECIDCKELPDKPKPPQNNPSILISGSIGTILHPLRSLPHHIAAICAISNYWELLESRSKKISESILQTSAKDRNRSQDMIHRGRHSQVFVPGQQVAVRSECLDWISYEATSPIAPKLPTFLRGFVLGECSLPIQNPHIGLWLPDYAAQALCTPDKLVVLPEFSNVRTFAPLLYLANACPPTPEDAVAIAIDLIHVLLLKNARLESIKILLDDKGPWKTVQLLKFITGEPRIKLLAIINKMTKDFERGNRAVVACCIHNYLADWLVWSVYTQRMSEFEQETLMEGLIQTLPRIDVRKWPKRTLLLQAVHALLRDCPPGNLQLLLTACKDILAWDPGNRSGHIRMGRQQGQGRQWQPRRSDHHDFRGRDRQRDFCSGGRDRDRDGGGYQNRRQTLPRPDEEGHEPEEQTMLRHSEYSIGRKPRPGEMWFTCTRATLSIVVPPTSEPTDCMSVIRSGLNTMIRGLLYKSAQQGVHCEIVNVASLREVRQPLLARLICGMLNSGGGKIYIGLGEHSLIQGVHAPRPERDSFTQGVLDVTTYSLDPRLLPFTFQLERRTVLKSKDHIPDGDWNRYVYVLHLRPLPDTVYRVIPEKQSFVRRPPEGTTVCLAMEQQDED